MLRPNQFVSATLLPGTVAAQYTVPGKNKAIIQKLTLCNTETATAYAVTIYFVASGGTAGASNMIKNAVVLAANETMDVSEAVGHVLNEGDTIQAFASTTDKISMRVSGWLFTQA
jgi:hypothetical protein